MLSETHDFFAVVAGAGFGAQLSGVVGVAFDSSALNTHSARAITDFGMPAMRAT